MKKFTKILIVLISLIVLLAGGVRPAYAAEFIDDGTIDAGDTINDDVFLTGDLVTMDGTVNGLLFAAGDTVIINGTVNGDALLFGNSITLAPGAKVDGNIFLGARTGEIEGDVTGSLFGGAAIVTLAEGANIGRNLYFGGYNFETGKGSLVTRDLFIGGYQAFLNGEVQRDVYIGAGALELTGRIGRNLNAHIGESGPDLPPSFSWQGNLPESVEPGLRISESAEIGGKLVYTSQSNQQETIKAEPTGGIVHQTPVPNENIKTTPKPSFESRYPALGWMMRFVRNLVTLLAFGAFALWLIPIVFQRIVDQARQQPIPSAGYGLLAIFSGYFSTLVAIAVILLIGLLLGLLSLGGLTAPVFGIGFSALAFAFAVFSFLIATGSKIIVAYLIGMVLIERAAPKTQNRPLWAMIAGVAIYVLISSVPLIGWLIGLIATLIGMGAIWLAYKSWKIPVSA